MRKAGIPEPPGRDAAVLAVRQATERKQQQERAELQAKIPPRKQP